MYKIKDLKGFEANAEVIYGIREEVLTDKEMKKLKSIMNGRPAFVRYKQFEQSPEFEALGFVRLEERIDDPLFFSFDRSDRNRKNLYVLEETPDYIDEKVKGFMPLVKPLKSINALDNRLNIQGYLNKETPIFYETINFYNVGVFTIYLGGNYYYFKLREEEFGKKIKEKSDGVLEKDVNEILHKLFGKFIRE